MRTFKELNHAVLFYCSKHGYMPKYIKRYPEELSISILAMDYTEIEGKIVKGANGKTKLVFKVDGKIESINK